MGHQRLDNFPLMPDATNAAARASELRIVMGGVKDDVQLSHDPVRNGGRGSIGVTTWGIGETLTRVSRQGKIVPWLAESIRNVDPLTWHVGLRRNPCFWDGSPLTAAAVAASFTQNCEQQTDVGALIERDTSARVLNNATVEFKTRQPVGHFPNALAHPQMIVHASDGALTTGPYRCVAFEPDRCMRMEPSLAHWAGRPLLEQITVSVDPDLDAQMHALEAGEADLIYAFPPEAIDRLEHFASGYELFSVPSMRALSIQINPGRPPFDDCSVREATALAIDRTALVGGVLGGHGALAASIVPPWAGPAAPLQSTDVARARQLLDAGGWKMGVDGVRCKGEDRLAFTMYTPRGEVLAMAALARAVRRQLAPLGYDIRIEEVAALSAAIKDGAYTSALRTSYAQLTGDPFFWLKLWLASGGRVNQGPTYRNPHFDVALDRYSRAIGSAHRQERWQEIEAILKADVPHIFLVWAPLIVVARANRLRGLELDPNNEYFIDGGLSVV
jgi:peptide/nickel transport system substrate-binding protein